MRYVILLFPLFLFGCAYGRPANVEGQPWMITLEGDWVKMPMPGDDAKSLDVRRCYRNPYSREAAKISDGVLYYNYGASIRIERLELDTMGRVEKVGFVPWRLGVETQELANRVGSAARIGGTGN